jgi:hypothetical protein
MDKTPQSLNHLYLYTTGAHVFECTPHRTVRIVRLVHEKAKDAEYQYPILASFRTVHPFAFVPASADTANPAIADPGHEAWQGVHAALAQFRTVPDVESVAWQVSHESHQAASSNHDLRRFQRTLRETGSMQTELERASREIGLEGIWSVPRLFLDSHTSH